MNKVIKQVKDFFSHKVDVVKQKLPEKYFGKFSAGYVFGAVGIFICVCVILFFSFRSCSSAEYDFRSSSDAIKCYREYLAKIQKTKIADGKAFCDEVNKWQEVRDTVRRYLIVNDSTFRTHGEAYNRFHDLNDSVRFSLMSLTETWKCSYSDVILVKEGTTPFRNDSDIVAAVNKAVPFFHELDNKKIEPVNKEEALENYRIFLTVIEKKGIHSKEDMLFFIEEEDKVFRQFLKHLYELDSEPVSDITHSTEHICSNIFREAREGNIDPKDALTYMSMRTVRRLLQNSVTCVNDIGIKKMHSKMQANAYLWMIIQPFTSIDAFAITTLTPESRENLKYIASKLPKSTMFAKAFEIDQEALAYLLPQQLLKMYILSL